MRKENCVCEKCGDITVHDVWSIVQTDGYEVWYWACTDCDHIEVDV
jgi:hypothetical protein